MYPLGPPWISQWHQDLLPKDMIVLLDLPSLKNLSGRSM